MSSSRGRGNFGNVLCFENVEKSIIVDDFMSTGHMMNTNKAGFDAFAEAYSRYSVEPGWKNLTRLMGSVVGRRTAPQGLLMPQGLFMASPGPHVELR